jgi:hypothetical protein
MATGAIDVEAVSAYLATAGDEPVVMVNLIEFTSPEHAQRFISGTRERTFPFLEGLGAESLYTGLAGPEFCANDDWDVALVVCYPNFAAVHRAVTDESIGVFVSKLREDTIERAEFIVTTPAPTG